MAFLQCKTAPTLYTRPLLASFTSFLRELVKAICSSTSLILSTVQTEKMIYHKEQISHGRAPLALRLRVQKLLQASFFAKEKSSWGCFLRGSQTLRVPIQAVPIQGRP